MSLKKAYIVLSVAILSIYVLAIQLPVVAQGDIPPATGLRPDAPPYAVHGPYAVGARDVVIGEGGQRLLEATIWYPALNPDGLEESIAYPIAVKVEMGLPADWEASIAGHALLDAAPDLTGAPYPLVIYSHGFGVNRQTSAYLTEHLASYGFVVISADHIEMWDPDLSEIWESSIERPQDVQQIIAYAESLTSLGGDMEGLFDSNQIAVVGHSYGGYTALAAAGARLDLEAFNAGCPVAAEGSEYAQFCNGVVPREPDMAALAGYDSIPEGLWPSWGDPRVKAIVSMAGTPYLFGEAGLKEVTVPTMALVGTLDTGGEGADATYTIYQDVSSSQQALVTFANADHYIFQWQCKDVPALVELGFFPVCTDLVWDMDRAHDLINHFTTAFLLATLKGDADATAALSPDVVVFPGITYEATGF